MFCKKKKKNNELQGKHEIRLHTKMAALHANLCMQNQPPHPENAFLGVLVSQKVQTWVFVCSIV